MKIFAESSAILTWLLGEPKADVVTSVLKSAETIVISDLAMVECRRVLFRAVVTGDLSDRESRRLLDVLGRAAVHWMRSAITAEIVEAASRRFPVEPVRALDAIHLATAVRTRNAIPGLKILSLDKRVRENGIALGFEVIPE